MASTISVRVYQINIHRRGDRTQLPFKADAGGAPVPAYVTNFISEHSESTEDLERERSWYFEHKVGLGAGSSKGYIHYGTFGFESHLVDSKTKKANYKRKTTDSEIVPLYYEFWHPPESNYMFAVFQSFQGRSCVHLVMEKMQELFEATYPGFLLQFKKLIPTGSDGSVYGDYPVQKLTFIKRNVSSDIADQYTGARPSEPAHLEVSLVARRRGNLGIFRSITTGLKQNDDGMIIHDGLKFDEATANIRVGKRTRPVGLFGGNSDAGVIDLSNSVKRGENGHPDFDSIEGECNEILKDFYETLGK